MILILFMFLIVKQKVKTDKAMIINVSKNPQQLDVSGYALSMGFAPKTSKNLKNSLIPYIIFWPQVKRSGDLFFS